MKQRIKCGWEERNKIILAKPGDRPARYKEAGWDSPGDNTYVRLWHPPEDDRYMRSRLMEVEVVWPS